ncbi:MAG: tRNA 2-thiouridine(34) synthase MnmA [Tepidisphaera sp.]|nr:tRNA 2-thiouridine(34) synthase MnmA [Tepidisphaera sp.]
MSGGVDSSVAAALLLREGYDVVGCFMRLGSPGETLDELTPGEEACEVDRASGPTKIGHQGCCSITDAADARAVAAELGVPFYVCNFKKDFGRIIDYFVDEYARGRTPNPCVRCNDWLKFGKLHEYAGQIGAEFVASGHYARVGTGEHGGPALMRGVDESKDQSYVLFGVPRAQLGRMLLPIGAMEKSRVRELAKEFGLPVFNKPDSQEICFVPDNDYAGLVERRRPGLAARGEVVDTSGKRLGEHDGQHRFTVGQRRGLSISLGYPIYVVGKDAASNTVVVGEKKDLLSRGCVAAEANWLVDEPRGWEPCWAQYRYNSVAVAARVRVVGDVEREDTGGTLVPPAASPSGRVGRFEVEFDEPQEAVAPGQAVVLYSRERPEVVMGGGWIHGANK